MSMMPTRLNSQHFGCNDSPLLPGSGLIYARYGFLCVSASLQNWPHRFPFTTLELLQPFKANFGIAHLQLSAKCNSCIEEIREFGSTGRFTLFLPAAFKVPNCGLGTGRQSSPFNLEHIKQGPFTVHAFSLTGFCQRQSQF